MTLKEFFIHLGEDIGNGIMYCCSMAQVEQALRIASFILSILISILIIISRVYEWWKKAKADGEITKDEIDELGHIVGDGIKDIKEHVDSANESQKGEK